MLAGDGVDRINTVDLRSNIWGEDVAVESTGSKNYLEQRALIVFAVFPVV
jgi:hypothetical protein